MTEVTIGFLKRCGSSDTSLDLRSTFDQIESEKYELIENNMLPSSNYLVTSPVPIKAIRDISQMLKEKHRYLRKTAIYEQHDNNHKLLVLSVPFPIHDVPKNK